MDMLMDLLWTIQWTLWTAYGHDDGLNIHNLWNRGLYHGHIMDYFMDCLWTILWTYRGLNDGLFMDMLMDGL